MILMWENQTFISKLKLGENAFMLERIKIKSSLGHAKSLILGASFSFQYEVMITPHVYPVSATRGNN